MTEAVAWATELTAIPSDQRRETSELASRLKVLAEEAERL